MQVQDDAGAGKEIELGGTTHESGVSVVLDWFGRFEQQELAAELAEHVGELGEHGFAARRERPHEHDVDGLVVVGDGRTLAVEEAEPELE